MRIIEVEYIFISCYNVMYDPFYKYSNNRSPTKEEIKKADKEARKLAVREKIAEEKEKMESIAAKYKLQKHKEECPGCYSDSDSDDDKEFIDFDNTGFKNDGDDAKAESSVVSQPDDPAKVYPSYIGRDGSKTDSPVADPYWFSDKGQSGANRSKRLRKTNRRVRSGKGKRVGTRKSKQGRTRKSKRGRTSKSKRVRN